MLTIEKCHNSLKHTSLRHIYNSFKKLTKSSSISDVPIVFISSRIFSSLSSALSFSSLRSCSVLSAACSYNSY